MPTQRRLEKMLRVIRNRQPDLTVVCENIHDPHNVSAMLRTCDAVGVETVYLLYTYQEFPELGKKSSASAKKWVRTRKFKDPQALRETLKQQEMTIYATRIEEGAISIFDIDWTQPAAIIMGNEHRGVSEEALSIADGNIYIPMFGMVQSLNVSVATAVILYEACRQRLSRGLYPNPRWDETAVQQKLEEWSAK